MNDSPRKPPLKDQLFTEAKVRQVATEIRRVCRPFDADGFVRAVVARFPELELKARIAWMAECLHESLPKDYERAVQSFVSSLPPPADPTQGDNDFGDFIYAPHSAFVARYGCAREHLDCSLDALYEFTQRFSAELAIRSFLNAFPEETLARLSVWVRDAHYHVRRLCSEGTRPKLPWAEKIAIPVEAPLPLLDVLVADTTRFVTRSVANHLNDISKTDPDLTIDTLARWRKSDLQDPKEMAYVVRHALRTLVKQGNPRALALLGFSPAPRLSVSKLVVPKEVRMNTALELSFTLTAKEDVDVVIDYVLHFRNKAGKLNSKKVYKLAKLSLTKNTPVSVSKRHPLRKNMTTRTLYPGEHALEIQINGAVYAKAPFLLV